MKRLIFILVIITSIAQAQAPEAFKFQAVIRGTDGALLMNKHISVRVSIVQTTVDGTAVYVETHSPTTNAVGIVNLEIGNGTSTSGDFTDIDWSADKYFAKIEMDPAGGSAYALIGTSQLLSVPYALYSKKAASTDGPWTLNNSDQSLNYNAGRVNVGDLSSSGTVNTKKINIGTTSQESPSAMFINVPSPTSEDTKSNGIFIQANDVLSMGFPLWLRSNTSSLTFGNSVGQTLGRLFRMQDQRHGFEAIWDFGIDENKSMFIMGGNNDFTKKLAITTDGKVGINMPAPNYTLDVNGTVNATSILMDGLPIAQDPWTVNSSNSSLSYIMGDVNVSNLNVTNLNASGKIGINKTNPAYTLDVNGPINATSLLVNGVPVPGDAGLWSFADNDISYTTGHVNIGTTTQETVSALYIDVPLPTSHDTRSNGIFLQANDVNSRGYPLWIRSNTNGLNYGFNEGDTHGRMLRLQDFRFEFDAIWDFGIDGNKSLFLLGGNNDYSRKFTITTTGNFGIGTETPLAKLDVTDGDIYINSVTAGVIMKSPNGSCFRMTVGDDGMPVFTSIPCPN